MLPVSVIIPCHNAAATLPHVLDSLAAQTAKPCEVIIIDDGSHDDTAGVVEQMREGLAPMQVVLIRQAAGGVAQARNRGLKQANQPLIAFVDADDCWAPEKLARQVSLFDDPEVVLAGTDFYTVASLAEPRRRLTKVMCSSVQARVGDGPAGLYGRNYLCTSSVIARADALTACGGFDESLTVMEDHDLWQRMARHGAVRVLPLPLLDYLDRPESLSKKALPMWLAGLRLAWRHRPEGLRGYGMLLAQATHVTARACLNLLRRGPMVGGTPLTPEKEI